MGHLCYKQRHKRSGRLCSRSQKEECIKACCRHGYFVKSQEDLHRQIETVSFFAAPLYSLCPKVRDQPYRTQKPQPAYSFKKTGQENHLL